MPAPPTSAASSRSPSSMPVSDRPTTPAGTRRRRRRVQELLARRQTLSQELATRLGARDDLRTELARIESDVAVVDARSARDADRLASSSNPKEAQGLESELASLARRKSDLEDGELEVMERLEQADAAVGRAGGADRADQRRRRRAERGGQAHRRRGDGGVRRRDPRSRRRRGVRARRPPRATTSASPCAAPARRSLRRRTCEGCRMVLAGTDLQVLRQATEDQIVTCPECGCILVRAEESGL